MPQDPPPTLQDRPTEPAAALVLVDNTAGPLAIAPRRTKEERLRGLLDAFLRGRKPSTLRAYALDLDQFTSFIGAPTREKAVAEFLALEAGEANEVALNYRSHMAEKKLGSATINRRLASLRALTKLARMLGLVAWKVEIENVPHENYTDVFGPGAENIGRLIELSLERGDPQGIRDAAIIRLLYDRGLRRGEVVGCDLEHYHPERGLALVGKGKTQRVWFTLPEATHAAVRAWIRVRGSEPGPLFTALNDRHCGHRLTGNRIYEIIRELGEVLGIRARPHGVRHAAISTALDRSKGDVRLVQRFSRHSDVRTVLRYDDARRDDALATAELVAGSVDLENDEPDVLTMRAKGVGYIRVSTVGQTEGHGLQRQREAIERWASHHRVELVAIVEEHPISGAAPIDKRPGLLEALRLLETTGAKMLIAEARDRLVRSAEVGSDLRRRLHALGAAAVTTSPLDQELAEKVLRYIRERETQAR
jgi:integrase/recombinase XerC